MSKRVRKATEDDEALALFNLLELYQKEHQKQATYDIKELAKRDA